MAKDYVAALTKRMKKEKELQWFAGIGHAVERLQNRKRMIFLVEILDFLWYTATW